MTEAGQMSIFDYIQDPDICSGRTCLAHSQAEIRKERISVSSSKKPQGSSTRLPLFLSLTRNGQTPEQSLWTREVWHGVSQTLNGGEFLNAEDGLLSCAISTDSPQPTFFLSLCFGEKPRRIIQTRLSEILEENPDERYQLSQRACQGILNRAARRGKDLPKELKDALTEQATLSKLGGGV